MSKVIIVLPTYNEKENIATLINNIFEISETNNININLVVVDDNSPDKTGEIVDDLIKKYPDRLFIIKRSGKLGLGTAYIEGFKYALEKKYDYIISMDADFSHHPKYLPAMIQNMENCDITIGSRYVPGGGTKNWGISRKALSSGANTLAHVLLGLQANDCTAGFRCYKAKVIESLDLDRIYSNGFSFLMELLYKCQKRGYKLGEIPIIFEDRRVGISKISKKEVFKAVATLSRFSWDRFTGGKE